MIQNIALIKINLIRLYNAVKDCLNENKRLC